MANSLKDILELGWKLEVTTNNNKEERYIFIKNFPLDDEDPDSMIFREVDINKNKKLHSTEMFLRTSVDWGARYLTMKEVDAFNKFMKEINNEQKDNN